MRRCLSVILTTVGTLIASFAFGQWHTAYHGPDSTNEITGISFYSPDEGFVASHNYIGYTQDGGSTFTKKYITYANVNFNNNRVNLTFGFTPTGIKAFNKDKILVYGDYGFEPSILYSADGGNTWKLVYHKNIRLDAPSFSNAIHDLQFINNSIGFALQHDEIVKTTDGGQTWVPSFTGPGIEFKSLSFADANTLFAVSPTRTFKMNVSINYWSEVSAAPKGAQKVQFVNVATGYLYCVTDAGARFYKTTNGGSSWVLCGNPDLFAPNIEDMFFTSTTTGFISAGGYSVYKTSDSGNSWELCKGSDQFKYLGYGFSKLFFLNEQYGWAGGYHDYLSKTMTAGNPTLPKARFKINKDLMCTNGIVQLENYSKTGYTYQWFLNDSLIGTSYQASYAADATPIDTIRLIVSNGVDSDTATQVTEAQALGSFSFHSRAESDTACTEKGVFILIPASDPTIFYAAFNGNIIEGSGYGNGGLLKLKCNYNGNSDIVEYRVEAKRYSVCGPEVVTNRHKVFFYSPFIPVTAKADTICSGIVQYVKVTNSIQGYEYWVDTARRVLGTGGEISLPLQINEANFGYRSSFDPYNSIKVKIFARHATWGCTLNFPRAEVVMVVRDPWARINVIDYELKTGQNASLVNSSLDTDFYHWQAEKDGMVVQESTERVPSGLRFSNPGKYRLTLFATSKQGCTDTASTVLEVYDNKSFQKATIALCAADTMQSDYFYKALDSYKDAAGNLYITGAKMKLASSFYTKGLEGWFLIKKDKEGNTLWEKSNTIHVGEGHIVTESVVADTYENVYIYGHLFRDRKAAPPYFVDTVYFGGGSSIAFVAKLNKKGKLLWMKTATNSSFDGRYYPSNRARSFAAGSLLIGNNNELFLKLSSDYATFNFGETPISSGTDKTYLFHFNQDGRLLDYQHFASKDALSDVPEINWDVYHHTPKMQWTKGGHLAFTAVLDSTQRISTLNGIRLSFDTRNVNTALFLYDTSRQKLIDILPVYQTANGVESALPVTSFSMDDEGAYYVADYNRVRDTLHPGPNSLSFPHDLSAGTDPAYKLKTLLGKYDASGTLVWQKLVDGFRPTGMFVMNGRLITAGENFTADFHKLGGHAYNSNIGEPYYYANRDTLFTGYPSPDRKKISFISDYGNSNGKGIEGAGGIDVLMVSMHTDGTNVELKTWGAENDERMYSLSRDHCGNLWGIGYTDLRATPVYYSFYHYNQPSANMMIWNWNYSGACNAAPCSSVKPGLRFEPAAQQDKCVDSIASLQWSVAGIDKINISYRQEGNAPRLLIQDYPADSLRFTFNIRTLNLQGPILFTIEAAGGTVQDTLSAYYAGPIPKTLTGRDTTLCYDDAIVLRAPEGPYQYAWRSGIGNHDRQLTVQSGLAGNIGVMVTDTVSGCSQYDFINIIRKPYFPQAQILLDLSSNEKIVSTQCDIRHEWRLNGALLADTGCILLPRDTGLYTVNTVAYGCASKPYGDARGQFRVASIPRKITIEKTAIPEKCVDSIFLIKWTASPSIATLRIGIQRAGATSFHVFASGIRAEQQQLTIDLRELKAEGSFRLILADEKDTTVFDTMDVHAGVKPVVALGAGISTCTGTDVVLQAPVGDNLSYLWSTGATGNQVTITANSGIRPYWLRVTTAAGCQASDTLQLTGISLPKPVLFRDTSNYLRTGFCGKKHRWYLNGMPVTGANDCQLKATEEGIYTVRIEEDHCISAWSDSLYVNFPQEERVTASPNPASDKVKISAAITTVNSNVRVEVIGENGLVLYAKAFPNQNTGDFSTEILLNFINKSGLYYVRTTVNGKATTIKLIVVK